MKFYKEKEILGNKFTVQLPTYAELKGFEEAVKKAKDNFEAINKATFNFLLPLLLDSNKKQLFLTAEELGNTLPLNVIDELFAVARGEEKKQ